MAESPHPLKCGSMPMGESTCSRIGVYRMDTYACAHKCVRVCLVFMCECMSEILYTCWTEIGTLFYL